MAQTLSLAGWSKEQLQPRPEAAPAGWSGFSRAGRVLTFRNV